MKFFLISLAVFASLSISRSYNSTISLKAFQYSKIAYCLNSTISNWKCGKDCDQKPGVVEQYLSSDQELQTQAYLAYNKEENQIIVAQRGTANDKNREYDAKENLIPYQRCINCKIHDGFNDIVNSFSEKILIQVKDLKERYSSAKLLITGHSLGGATAVITALEIFHQIGIKADELITFGQPRIGNQEFADYVHKIFPNYTRIVHYKDIVPHLSFRSKGYVHSPNEIWYNTETWGTYIVCSSTNGEDPNCSNSVPNNSIPDHLSYFGEYTGCSTDNPYSHLESSNITELKSFLK